MTADITKHTPTPTLARVVEFLRVRFPNVADVALLHGDAFDGVYAVSVRHHGARDTSR